MGKKDNTETVQDVEGRGKREKSEKEDKIRDRKIK